MAYTLSQIKAQASKPISQVIRERNTSNPPSGGGSSGGGGGSSSTLSQAQIAANIAKIPDATNRAAAYRNAGITPPGLTSAPIGQVVGASTTYTVPGTNVPYRNDAQASVAGYYGPETQQMAVNYGNYAMGLPSTYAPDNANAISNLPVPKIPELGGSTTGITGVNGLMSYYQSLFETQNQQAQDYADQQKELQKTQETTKKGIFDFLSTQKTPEQLRTEANAQTGINPVEYFAAEKAKIAEIGALNEEYNAKVAARDAEIAQVQGAVGGGMTFMNNRIAQINRNSAPVLNQLAANLNSKAAILQASQGMFQEAQQYVNQAVQAATAAQKQQFDSLTTIYNMNQDAIDSLDTKYKDSFNLAISSAESAWKTSVDQKTKVGELMINNPQANITINDSLEEAMRKVGLNPVDKTSIDYQLKQAQLNKALTPDTGPEDKSTQSFMSDASSYIEKLGSNTISWGTAFNALKAKYPQASNELIDNTLGKQRYYTVTGK